MKEIRKWEKASVYWTSKLTSMMIILRRPLLAADSADEEKRSCCFSRRLESPYFCIKVTHTILCPMYLRNKGCEIWMQDLLDLKALVLLPAKVCLHFGNWCIPFFFFDQYYYNDKNVVATLNLRTVFTLE